MFTLALIFALLICLFLSVLLAIVFYLDKRLKSGWASLRILYRERFALYADILGIAKQTYAPDSDTLNNYTELLLLSEKITAPYDYKKTAQRLNLEYAKLCGLIKKYPLLYETERFAQLSDKLIRNEENLLFAIQFYNESALLFNKRVFTFPVKIAANIFNLRKKKTL